MVLRSDDRGMSHSANIGLELRLVAGLSRFTFNTPAVPRFRVTAAPLGPRRHQTAHSMTTFGSIASIGHVQPRFNLVVTHAGIDNQELGALGDGFAGGALLSREMPSTWLSRGCARPTRLAPFSSCQSHS